jgi:hypothetical protein
MSKCIDPQTGTLIHGFELNALPDKDFEQFAIHLLQCDACFEEVRAMKEQMAVMRNSSAVAELMGTDAGETAPSKSRLSRVFSHLWPDKPLWLRPGLIYLVVLALVFPAYQGLMVAPVEQVQEIPQTLVFAATTRSATGKTFQKHVSSVAAIVFHIDSGRPAGPCRIIIENNDGIEVYRNDRFTSLDEHQNGTLLLNLAALPPGIYSLKAVDPNEDPPLLLHAYFKIEE